MTPGKIYESSKIKKIISNKIRFLLNFENSQKNFVNPQFFVLFCFVLQCIHTLYKKKMLTVEI